MKTQSKNEFNRSSRVTGQLVSGFLSIAMIASPAAGQQQSQERRTPSITNELAVQNSRRVAAPAGEIEAVLRRDAGILVELKRWVAKEATDRGQLVDDAAMTDSAIFARLQADLEFRSTATQLLQRYGYLLPKMNPDSEMAQEQKLLLEERVRRIAKARDRDEEEERARMQREQQTDSRLDRTSNREGLRDRDGREIPSSESGRSKKSEPQRRDRDSVQTADSQVNSGLSEFEVPPGQDRALTEIPNQSSSQLQRIAQAVGKNAGNSALGENRLTGDPESDTTDSRLRRSHTSERTSTDRMTESRETEAGELRRTRMSDGMGEETELSRSGMVRRPNPYSNIPSLYEMYAQAKSKPGDLKRFGLDALRNSDTDLDRLPMDLPVGPDYVVGPGDGLSINLWGGVSQRISRIVDREGRINLPEAGPVLVSGKSMGEVQQSVQRILRTQFRDVSADVSLSRLRTVRIYVVGDVEQAGAYDISSLSTPLNALLAAGGPSTRGSARVVRHMRGDKLIQEVDLYDLLLRGVRGGILQMQNGDTLLVPPLGGMITVEGAVRRPAKYELAGEKNLAQALELAGGILPTATLRNIQVQRLEAHQKRTMLSLDISESQNDETARKKLESFSIQDGDEIRIFPIANHNEEAIFLEGHVLRPGRYSYKPGMKVTDLVSGYADLLPEPAKQYGEIVRLNAPDFRPTVESFNLGAALANPAAAPELKPQDTVRIFSRFDFENPPSVWVGGEVRKPGLYKTSGQVHLRDAIQLAGGAGPDALMESAQVFSYQVDSTLKIYSVDLSEALAGNPIHNVLLQPRDRVIVHRNLTKADPPSVYVQGEIDKPGRYPLTANMKVSDLIRLSGGLKRGAFQESADLTRFVSDGSNRTPGEHLEISIAAAMSGDAASNVPLRDGDTLAIRQLPGWNDVGASILISGELLHPGTYGIKPGERLSAVLKRAGGMLPTAYAPGAVLERLEVRELQQKAKLELIRRVQDEADSTKFAMTADNPQEQDIARKAAKEHQQRVLETLRQAPITGRMVIRLYSNKRFEGSADDVEVRAGDRLYVPKRPEYVMVIGQVYNSNAVTFTPHKNAGFYLSRAGGPTELAEKGRIFIVRANGEVVTGQGIGWWGGGVLSTGMQPGDTLVVPERAIGLSQFWRNFSSIAQIASSVAVAVSVATR